MLRRITVVLAMLVWASWALANAPIEDVEFKDPAQLQRYKALIAELRCPKCLNANLASSDSPIAADLREEIQKQLVAGKSDQEILDYLVARYGEFILYKPPLHLGTAFLWFGPPLLLLIGLFVMRRLMKGTSVGPVSSAELSQEEQQRLQQLLKPDQQGAPHG